MTPHEYVDYYTKPKWGRTYEDDKYVDSELLEDSFIVFYTYVFAHLGLPRPTYAQYAMALFVSDASNPHRILMAQRGLAKSLTSQIYVLWRLLNNPEEKILIMSAGRTRASSYSQFVQKLIKMLPVTQHMTPRHGMERTSGESFDVAGAAPSDSPSMYAVGAATQVTGFRASLIIYDDIETAVTVESVVKTEAINTYAGEAQNLLMSGKDESITLSTPHSINSIYIEWIEERGYKPFIIPAYYTNDTYLYWGGLAPFITDRLKNDPTLLGQPVDERLNAEFLMSKKMRIGKSKFKLQYEIDVSDSDALRFPLKLSDFIVADIDDDTAPLKIGYSSMPDNILYQKHNGFAKDKLYMPRFESPETAEYDYKIMSIDTAGRGADETGISIIYHLNSRLFVKKIIGLEGGYEDEILIGIAELCKMHKINTLVIEENFSDGMFTKMIEPHIARISPKTEIEGIRVSGQKEVRIIESLEPLLNQHRIVLGKEVLEYDITTTKSANSFAYQLSHLTREKGCLRHDDRIDSLSNGVSFMIEWMSDDEDRGFEYHVEKSARDIYEYTLAMFGNKSNRKSLNFGDRF